MVFEGAGAPSSFPTIGRTDRGKPETQNRGEFERANALSSKISSPSPF